MFRLAAKTSLNFKPYVLFVGCFMVAGVVDINIYLYKK